MKFSVEVVTDSKGRFLFPRKFRGWCTHGVRIEETQSGWRVQREEKEGSPLDDRGRMRIPMAANKQLNLNGKLTHIDVTEVNRRTETFAEFLGTRG